MKMTLNLKEFFNTIVYNNCLNNYHKTIVSIAYRMIVFTFIVKTNLSLNNKLFFSIDFTISLEILTKQIITQ